MTVDTSQRVIVGYTASVGTAYQTNIQVKGNSASGYAGYGVTTSNNESAGLFGAYSNGENSLWIASDPDNLRAGSRTVFTVDGTQTAQINPFGIGVGSATPTSGTGITFPATQSASSDANTLDDYEEGSFTPTIAFSSGTTGITYSQQIGRYIKVGTLVFIQYFISLSSKGSSSGNLELTGLPFTLGSVTDGYFCTGIQTLNLTSTIQTLLQLNAAGQQFNVMYSGLDTTITNTVCQNTTAVRAAFCYRSA